MSDPMDFSKIMKMVGNLQQNAQQMQERLVHEKVTGDAGGGMVVIEMNGLQQVTRVHIDPELLADGDVDMLQDLVAAAVNRCQEGHKRLLQESAGLGGMDLSSLFGKDGQE
jgi:nucleoid-associated protein EbfC